MNQEPPKAKWCKNRALKHQEAQEWLKTHNYTIQLFYQIKIRVKCSTYNQSIKNDKIESSNTTKINQHPNDKSHTQMNSPKPYASLTLRDKKEFGYVVRKFVVQQKEKSR